MAPERIYYGWVVVAATFVITFVGFGTAPWRWMPNDLPPWEAVYQQAQR